MRARLEPGSGSAKISNLTRKAKKHLAENTYYDDFTKDQILQVWMHGTYAEHRRTKNYIIGAVTGLCMQSPRFALRYISGKVNGAVDHGRR